MKYSLQRLNTTMHQVAAMPCLQPAHWLLLLTCLLAPAGTVHAESAEAIYNRGDHANALKELKPLAEAGDYRLLA